MCCVPSISNTILQVSKTRFQTINPMPNVDHSAMECDFPTLGLKDDLRERQCWLVANTLFLVNEGPVPPEDGACQPHANHSGKSHRLESRCTQKEIVTNHALCKAETSEISAFSKIILTCLCYSVISILFFNRWGN